VSLRDGGSVVRLGGGFQRVGLVGRRRDDPLDAILDRVVGFARARGLILVPEPHLQVGGLASVEPLGERPEIDLLLTLGGDGTLLRGVRQVAPQGIPVLGVNLGRLGFLTSISPPDLESALDKALAGEAFLDPRFTLAGEIVYEDGSTSEAIWALNDLVLHQAGVARVVRLDLGVGEGKEREEVGSFAGDGVIIATPTGSTAYSLSAGGPIIAPTMECIAVTPISPHTMAMRPLVLPDHVLLTILALDRYEELVLTADGQQGYPLPPGAKVRVRKGPIRVCLVRFEGQTFFDTLRRALNWAG
jgi:NAD+ kinase